MIDFIEEKQRILFKYTADYTGSVDWIIESIKRKGFIKLKRTYSFQHLHLLNNEEFSNKDEVEDYEEDYNDPDLEPVVYFNFAQLEGDYWKITRGVIVDSFDIYIHKHIPLKNKYFVANSDVSVFNAISKISKSDFYLGGGNSSAIPLEEFNKILQFFPTDYERRKYVEARLSSVIRNYLDGVRDAEKSYQKFLDSKLTRKGKNLKKTFQEIDTLKYETILQKLNQMLKDEAEYNEHQWQDEILQIIQLLYPKYILAFKSVPIQARLSSGIKDKQLDLLLIDSNGYVDIIEIKKPFDNVIMTKGLYRDNYIPLRELSGTVMQIEKYIYFLNRWSTDGEKFLTERYKEQLPDHFEIKIANPSGLIIMGREGNLTADQKSDFEVVKRKYKNVVEIITYDNLIDRLIFTIDQIRKN
ncbi:Shedu immune nuclease family protein [Chryseobacterium sp. SL1]|uniref:Shedu immune nuclease family protein n=1 Tax=Chryseobacterium sp. SL1 TaxID=2995159 RepID=UPI002272E5B0|nr:Shedu immune nuclease family protein [Chryseobacterium sp. SL1]MCY1662623.1 DUF4263 domain-containing protein [Chryseobacterium sp. SL1]